MKCPPTLGSSTSAFGFPENVWSHHPVMSPVAASKISSGVPGSTTGTSNENAFTPTVLVPANALTASNKRAGRIRTGRIFLSLILLQNGNHFGLDAAGHMDLVVGVYKHVVLETNAELRQVDSRLDREARALEDATLVVRLQVVHVGAVAVDLFADRMTGAVHELIAVSRFLDDITRGVVDFPTVHCLADREAVAHFVDGRIARCRDDVEYLGVFLRN